MNKKLRQALKTIILAAVLYIVAICLPVGWEKNVFYALAYVVSGFAVIKKSLRNICHGDIFDENFLMMVATFGAIALGEYSEAVAVMLFFQIGEFFQSYAVNQSRKSIASLMDIRPDYANVYENGVLKKVSPEVVKIGDVIVVQTGERIPLDGVVIKGQSSLDTKALTGESLPRDVSAGDEVVSGCINLSGVLEIKTTKVFANSTVAKILDLVENASSKKANIENFITRFARYYTPIVVVAAAALAVLPPLLFSSQSFAEWVYRAITFLVISCPCALVISVPLSFFGGLGAASKAGVLVKGGNYLEALAHAETIVFDKTGTLTKGNFKLTQIVPCAGETQKELLRAAAYVECYSNHPIALSIKQAFKQKINHRDVSEVREIFGVGVSARVGTDEIAVGNRKIFAEYQLPAVKVEAAGSVVFVVKNQKYIGYLLIEDELKEDAISAVAALKNLGHKLVMLTGDRQEIGQNVARKFGLDAVYAELLPTEKVDKLEAILATKSAKGKVMFVGDGINDAPVLARSDVGVAMGAIGSDAALEAADVVIMTDEPSKILTAIKIAKKTLLIARENVVFAIGVKLLVLVLGAMGYASIWAAVFADVGVSVIAILNAVRSLYIKN